MTVQQLELDLQPLTQPDYAPELTIDERFDAFHSANPWVLQALIDLAEDWSNHGGRRIGVKGLVETLRWHHVRATRGDTFKVNNTLVSRYARRIIAERPHLASVIETRELRAA